MVLMVRWRFFTVYFNTDFQYIVNYFLKKRKKIRSIQKKFVLLQPLSRGKQRTLRKTKENGSVVQFG